MSKAGAEVDGKRRLPYLTRIGHHLFSPYAKLAKRNKKAFSRSANYRKERENACDKKADMQRVHTGLWG